MRPTLRDGPGDPGNSSNSCSSNSSNSYYINSSNSYYINSSNSYSHYLLWLCLNPSGRRSTAGIQAKRLKSASVRLVRTAGGSGSGRSSSSSSSSNISSSSSSNLAAGLLASEPPGSGMELRLQIKIKSIIIIIIRIVIKITNKLEFRLKEVSSCPSPGRRSACLGAACRGSGKVRLGALQSSY